MVLAAPGPLLTPTPSSSHHLPLHAPRRPLTGPTPPKFDPRMKRRTTPPKQYLPLQTRTRHRRSHRPHPMCKVDEHVGAEKRNLAGRTRHRTRASAGSAYGASQPSCTHMMRPPCALCRANGSAFCIASRILCTSRGAQSAHR